MAEYISQKICDMIDDIESGKLVLPAMQRNFVWSENKVCDLFDSIIRDYPIGTFLFWEVTPDIVRKYAFNTFITEYNEQISNIQRGNRVVNPNRSEYVGVLDGQQRITSIYVGLKGKYRTKRKGKRRTSEDAYVDRYLCLNILNQSIEDGHYQFAFQPVDKIDRYFIPDDIEETEEYWVKVGDVFNNNFDPSDYMDLTVDPNNALNPTVRRTARKMLEKMKTAFYEKNVVSYYPAKNQSLLQVVDIFVRVNSGGEKLSASDLMLSVATGSQTDEDIHIKLQNAIEKISSATSSTDDTGFVADKELILTAGLLFTNASSLSLKKAENYEQHRISEILSHWDDIVDALFNAARYIERIGFIGRKLTSKNLILPIAYYLYKNNLNDAHRSSSSVRAIKDRVLIRQWLLRAMINSIFRDGIGATLISIRNIIDRSKHDYFPLDDLMAASSKRSLKITGDTIDDILQYRYGDGRILPLLCELQKAPADRIYHIDHIWAQALMKSKKEVRKLAPVLTDTQRESFRLNCDYLANLQLLEPTQNQEKNDRLFDEWSGTVHPDATDRYYTDNCIPNVSFDFDNFTEFFDERSKLLKKRIEESFPADFDAIISRYHLT